MAYRNNGPTMISRCCRHRRDHADDAGAGVHRRSAIGEARAGRVVPTSGAFGGADSMKTDGTCLNMPIKLRFCRHIKAIYRCHRHIVAPPVVDTCLVQRLEEIGYDG